MGHQEPLRGGVPDDRLGGRRDRRLLQARARRGPAVYLPHHGGERRLAGSDPGGDALAGHRAPGAHPARGAQPGQPAQLHPTGRRDHLRGFDRRHRPQGGGGHLVPGAQEGGGHAPHPAPGDRRAWLQRRVRRYLRHHLRLHRRRLHPTRAARLCRGSALEAVAGPGRVEGERLGGPGRAHLRRVRHAHPGGPGPRSGYPDMPPCQRRI